MPLSHRWPLHPFPKEGEALSSWLWRVANRYKMNLPDLLLYDLGYTDINNVDLDPPMQLLDLLSSRSGISVEQLRSMSLAGCQPWLLDRLDLEPSAFDTYVRQLSILLPLKKRPSRTPIGWRAWLPSKPIYRACPICLNSADDKVLLLIWQLPLLLSCPFHGCLLETYPIEPSLYISFNKESITPQLADVDTITMDRWTWQAWTTGRVNLPRRSIHAGLWFRLLRTLLDELNTPFSLCPSRAKSLRSLWTNLGYLPRAGLITWKAFESLSLSIQLQMLTVAAASIGMIKDDMIMALGADVDLFRPEPMITLDDGRLTLQENQNTTIWQKALDSIDKAVSDARGNPDTAQHLLQIMLIGNKSNKSIERARDILISLGVPREFLLL